MKIPEKAINWLDVLASRSKEILRSSTNESVLEVIKKANSEYLYWDKFKYLDFPNGFNAEDVWAYLKMNRNSSKKNTPVIDKEGFSFWYWLPDIVLKDLSLIDKKAGGEILADDSSLTDPQSKNRFLINSIMEESIASSQLEGAATTRKNAKEMLRSGKKPKTKSEQMIYNNYHTITWLKQIKNEPLTPELIKEIQKRITTETLEDSDTAGCFQTEGEKRVSVWYQNLEIFEPPKASEINQRIQALCNFANQPESESEFDHPILKAIVLHFWLAYIHPFPDGNGRTSRALFYWYALKNEYWQFEYLSISRVVLKAPVQYIRAFLYSEIDECDLTYFLTFHLRIIRLAIKDLQQYLHKKRRELSKIRELDLLSTQLNFRQGALLRYALKHPNDFYTTIKIHQNIYKVVYQTARTDLASLEKLGFLTRKKIGNEFCFYPAPNLYERISSSNLNKK
jgi:Fic family protein